MEYRHLGRSGGVAFRQLNEALEPVAIFGAQLYRGLDITDSIVHAPAQSGERLIGFPL